MPLPHTRWGLVPTEGVRAPGALQMEVEGLGQGPGGGTGAAGARGGRRSSLATGSCCTAPA